MWKGEHFFIRGGSREILKKPPYPQLKTKLDQLMILSCVILPCYNLNRLNKIVWQVERIWKAPIRKHSGVLFRSRNRNYRAVSHARRLFKEEVSVQLPIPLLASSNASMLIGSHLHHCYAKCHSVLSEHAFKHRDNIRRLFIGTNLTASIGILIVLRRSSRA